MTNTERERERETHTHTDTYPPRDETHRGGTPMGGDPRGGDPRVGTITLVSSWPHIYTKVWQSMWSKMAWRGKPACSKADVRSACCYTRLMLFTFFLDELKCVQDGYSWLKLAQLCAGMSCCKCSEQSNRAVHA